MTSLAIKAGQGDYAVDFVNNLLALVKIIQSVPRAVLVIDRQVAGLYHEVLAPLTAQLPVIEIDATEDEKSLAGVTKVLGFLQQSNATRQTNLVVMGGGIVQDIASFAAHVYYRGLKWIFVPTTLLSMSDSCIGAKVAINFNGFKNQLGFFHAPARVLVCTSFLATLSDIDIRSGYGEIVKLALTGSAELFNQVRAAVEGSGFRNPQIAALIYQSLNVKKSVIEIDEYETDLRRILNYGHTFGHALEGYTDYEVPHGLGVAWGIDVANWIAYRRGLLSEADYAVIHAFLAQHFKFHITRTVQATDLIERSRRDKKVAEGRLNLILLERPGRLKIVPVEYDASLAAAITEYLDKSSIITSR